MDAKVVTRLLCNGPVIPAVRNYEDLKYAFVHTDAPALILLFGDINTLPSLLSQAKQHKKRLLVHFDLLEGVGKDKAGVNFLARMGVNAMTTIKPHLARMARDEGMLVMQRLFLMDSDSVKTGIHLLRTFKPDALEVLPSTIPASVVKELNRETQLPIFAGGLADSVEEVANALRNGILAVSTSKRDLWTAKIPL